MIDHILSYPDSPDTEPLFHEISRELWSTTQYISGSALKTVPYEIVYALQIALKDWSSRNFIITTAIIDERNYYFKVADPNSVIKPFLKIDMDVNLVQIAFPKLYRHRPLYNIALYHELGHFIDHHFQIVAYSELLDLYNEKDQSSVSISHRREYFADLVAACYVGRGYVKFVRHFIRNEEESCTHPSSEERLKVINDFLNGKSNNIVDRFQRVLELRKLPALRTRFDIPDILPRFENVLPYDIASNAELHGIFAAGWEFLEGVFEGKFLSWNELEQIDADRIINDLIEKSIRNRVISEKWHEHTD